MRILFVEDTDFWIKKFKPILEKFGEVTHFKSSNLTCRWLSGSKVDLVVCDHQILKFKEEPFSQASGDEIYDHLRLFTNKQGETVPFIHFSAMPCPEKYDTKDDRNFYCLSKSYDTEEPLTDLITKLQEKFNAK